MNLLLISKVLQNVKGMLVSTGLTVYILAVSGHQTLLKICKTLTGAPRGDDKIVTDKIKVKMWSRLYMYFYEQTCLSYLTV